MRDWLPSHCFFMMTLYSRGCWKHRRDGHDDYQQRHFEWASDFSVTKKVFLFAALFSNFLAISSSFFSSSCSWLLIASFTFISYGWNWFSDLLHPLFSELNFGWAVRLFHNFLCFQDISQFPDLRKVFKHCFVDASSSPFWGICQSVIS